jgi:crossover junction endodeoxyribonuclease RusA
MSERAPSYLMTTLDIPREWLLTANQRLHWRPKAARTAALRFSSKVRVGNRRVPFANRVRCVVHVTYPDARRRDVHNLMPTVKACVDGVVDAGWLTDDSDKYLEGPDLRPTDERCDKGLACSLVFTFEEIA